MAAPHPGPGYDSQHHRLLLATVVQCLLCSAAAVTNNCHLAQVGLNRIYSLVLMALPVGYHP